MQQKQLWPSSPVTLVMNGVQLFVLLLLWFRVEQIAAVVDAIKLNRYPPLPLSQR